MNEIFKDAFYISGTICFVTITFAAIKGMAVMRALWVGSPPVAIDPVPNGVIEQNDSVFDVPEAGILESTVGLECGQCHSEIKTAPVSVQGVPPFEKAIYHCEHCGTDVAVPT